MSSIIELFILQIVALLFGLKKIKINYWIIHIYFINLIKKHIIILNRVTNVNFLPVKI